MMRRCGSGSTDRHSSRSAGRPRRSRRRPRRPKPTASAATGPRSSRCRTRSPRSRSSPARPSTIELGTAVIPIWLRHPLMLAAQALTLSEIAGGRVLLGIGLAHKSSIEDSLGIPFARPAATMERVPRRHAPGAARPCRRRDRVDLLRARRGRRRSRRRADPGRDARGHGAAHARARRRPHRRHDPLAERAAHRRDPDPSRARGRRARTRDGRRRASSRACRSASPTIPTR